MIKTCLPVVILVVAGGCASKSAQSADDARPKLQLAEIHRMIKHEANQKQPPSRMEDLRRFEPTFPFALHALRSGECVMVWTTVKAVAEDAVLAYAKTAPSQGGLVVLKNGNVKTMTAAELKSSLPVKR